MRDAQAQAAELVYQNQQAAYAEAARKLQRERQEKQGLFRGRDWDLSRPDQLRIDCPARYHLKERERGGKGGGGGDQS